MPLAARGGAWGPREVGLGLGLAVLCYIATTIAVPLFALALGRDLRITDEPVFDAAARLAQFTDERLRAAALGEPLPDPPKFAADLVTARIAYGLTAVNGAVMAAVALFAMSRWRGPVFRALRMTGYGFERIWRPALVTVAGYLLVIVYTIIVTVLDIDFLKPSESVPTSILRDPWGLAIFGFIAVLAAPISEEILFRGLVFGGLVRWGFWPAALISGIGFSLAHLDPGTLIPFTLIGMALAWAFWSTGSLWDAILAHAFFNTTSYLLLLSRV